MSENALLSALNTIAQCAAALAALIGFFGMWRLDRHREEVSRLQQAIVRVTILSTQDSPTKAQLLGHEHYLKEGRELANAGHIELTPLYARFDALPGTRRRLLGVLIGFLGEMLLLLILAIVGFLFVDTLKHWAATPWLIGFASVGLGIGTACVIWQAARFTEVEHEW